MPAIAYRPKAFMSARAYRPRSFKRARSYHQRAFKKQVSTIPAFKRARAYCPRAVKRARAYHPRAIKRARAYRPRALRSDGYSSATSCGSVSLVTGESSTVFHEEIGLPHPHLLPPGLWLGAGRTVKNNKQVQVDEPDDLKLAPHSFVIHRGSVGKYVQELTRDFRKVMEPYTASSLKARRKNSLKDFVSVSGILHVSHLCVFTHTDISTYMKLANLPRGPTLTFKVHNYSLSRDVASMLKKQMVFDRVFKNSPLIVLNSFSGEGMHLKLMASMFQNMFPTINVTKVNLSTIRRCVLLNYNPTSKLIDFRHYVIKLVPVGLSRGVKKIVQNKVPNLGRLGNISEFFTKSNMLSESEYEDDPSSHVVLPQTLTSRGNIAGGQSGIRVHELGPRLTLQLMKVEDGLMNGEVLFHELIQKTDEEKLFIKKKRDEKSKLKEKRKKTQEENTKKKIHMKEEQKQKTLKGMQRKNNELEADVMMKKAVLESNQTGAQEDDDDAAWYRQEVGEEPDTGVF
uniref:Brix domain-containing protein n=1 Tax=Timema tahoe TaxID=61484 RepID=A0A7R9IB02_9NEOP|nr:unnamed protein product [Timema tahoe]